MQRATWPEKVPLLIFPSDFVLDRAARLHLHHQIYDFIRRAILGQRLKPGAKLPSTRWLAARVRVSRNTVLRAYEALLLDGLIECAIGSGTRVADPQHAAQHQPILKIPDTRTMLREAHYPVDAIPFEDPQGNVIYLHR
jgi:DNA-binding GntR family transcriptional regulator